MQKIYALIICLFLNQSMCCDKPQIEAHVDIFGQWAEGNLYAQRFCSLVYTVYRTMVPEKIRTLLKPCLCFFQNNLIPLRFKKQCTIYQHKIVSHSKIITTGLEECTQTDASEKLCPINIPAKPTFSEIDINVQQRFGLSITIDNMKNGLSTYQHSVIPPYPAMITTGLEECIQTNPSTKLLDVPANFIFSEIDTSIQQRFGLSIAINNIKNGLSTLFPQETYRENIIVYSPEDAATTIYFADYFEMLKFGLRKEFWSERYTKHCIELLYQKLASGALSNSSDRQFLLTLTAQCNSTEMQHHYYERMYSSEEFNAFDFENMSTVVTWCTSLPVQQFETCHGTEGSFLETLNKYNKDRDQVLSLPGSPTFKHLPLMWKLPFIRCMPITLDETDRMPVIEQEYIFKKKSDNGGQMDYYRDSVSCLSKLPFHLEMVWEAQQKYIFINLGTIAQDVQKKLIQRVVQVHTRMRQESPYVRVFLTTNSGGSVGIQFNYNNDTEKLLKGRRNVWQYE
jgi:hypothetical protein